MNTIIKVKVEVVNHKEYVSRENLIDVLDSIERQICIPVHEAQQFLGKHYPKHMSTLSNTLGDVEEGVRNILIEHFETLNTDKYLKSICPKCRRKPLKNVVVYDGVPKILLPETVCCVLCHKETRTPYPCKVYATKK